MSTDTTYGDPQGIDKPISREDWVASPETESVATQVDDNGDVTTVQVIDKPSPKPSQTKPRPVRSAPEDPDKFLLKAKALVVQNYNEHRDPKRSPVLTMDLVFITWFAKAPGSWKAVVCSSIVRGLLWEVAYNGELNEAYLDIYKRLNHVKIPFGSKEKTA
jgi:hypothetical protein